MKRLSFAWWLALVLLLLGFAAIRLPAAMLGWLLEKQTNGLLALHASQGGIWQGQGQLVMRGEVLLERMSWQWQPRDLLRGKFGLQLQADGGHATVKYGLGGLQLEQVELNLNAAPLLKLDKRLASYGLGGRFRLAAPVFHYGGKPEGNLTLDWQQANSKLTQAIGSLGDYRATLIPQGESWQIAVQTLSGNLQINGGGVWSAKDGLNADIGLRANPGADTLLAGLMAKLGPGEPGAERRMRFNFK